MSNWSPQDWGIFFGAVSAFLAAVAAIVTPILQLVLNSKMNKSTAISLDNNAKITEVHNAVAPPLMGDKINNP